MLIDLCVFRKSFYETYKTLNIAKKNYRNFIFIKKNKIIFETYNKISFSYTNI